MPKETKKIGSGSDKSKAAKPVDPQDPKSEKAKTYKIKAFVKVKLDKECGLPEAARMVIERHAEHLLESLLIKDPMAVVESEYIGATPNAVRIKNWDLLDLRPGKAADDKQEEIKGT